ncbi:hypothetical protein [Qaidamihabitans albus]|uniref:hypothetical protein n=1 Tax=Qaidamihabitans albus TaxID=2795733 RepID=UPI0018F13732|nr:hypothetical protein [Qaidamihabitans albus]
MAQRRRYPALVLALACAALGLAPVPVTAADTVTWTLHPGRGGDDVRTTFSTTAGPQRIGTRVFPPKDLATPVDTVGAESAHGRASTLDVRGLRADGTWSEWTPVTPGAPAVLPEPATSVQARLVQTAPERVGPVELTGRLAGHGPQAEGTEQADRAAGPMTFRVFATREGLVGGTTANGHRIVRRDHFVALPSRRGLAARGKGDYTVRVCTIGNARCEWAPVWDVGPWNTRDDHWNPGRESWPDLPHGKPQAQAAYEDGHNGGRDQFGRKVANPAGIDLADGTFWDGLRLKTNAWVNVTYEWTASGPWGTVVTPAGVHLNVRAGTSASTPQVGYAARHARVRLVCSVTGDVANGTQGSSDTWYRLARGKHVAAAYIDVAVPPTPC